MKQLGNMRLDGDAETVRREHADAIRELQRLPLSSARVISDVSLADGVATPVSHGLGRRPLFVIPSVPRGAVSAGYIIEVRDGIDRTQSVKLTASGYGATITVDLVIG